MATGKAERDDVGDPAWANYLVTIAMFCGHSPAEARSMSMADLERLELIASAMNAGPQ